ncbi:MAG: site-specific integrase [Gemmatimonadetes bacterium]|nr:site-specific integrase [Gemmatimonadota bacterium]MYJ37940.1 site-specific integrase [Gemmatimonadota bacterium]
MRGRARIRDRTLHRPSGGCHRAERWRSESCRTRSSSIRGRASREAGPTRPQSVDSPTRNTGLASGIRGDGLAVSRGAGDRPLDGDRIGAIRQLRWSDIDMVNPLIRWRAENEKTGYGHRTLGHGRGARRLGGGADAEPEGRESPVLPAPKDPSRCLDRSRVRVWWKKAEALAGLEPKRGRGWHSLRRKFASDLMHQPLKVLCQLGGWKTAQTVLQCYQRADEDKLRKALEDRRRVSMPANWRASISWNSISRSRNFKWGL